MTYPAHEAGRSYSLDYLDFHSGPDCRVNLIKGPGYLVAYCTFCRIAGQLEAVALKVDPQQAANPRSAG